MNNSLKKYDVIFLKKEFKFCNKEINRKMKEKISKLNNVEFKYNLILNLTVMS